MGRFNLWHVAGEANVSKVVLKSLFLGHEAAITDSPTAGTDASAAPTDPGTVTTQSPSTGENKVLLVIDVILLAVSAGMLLLTKRKRED